MDIATTQSSAARHSNDINPCHNHSLNLMDVEFNAQEAKQQILKMLVDNIQYHSQRNFSSEERFGNPDLTSKAKMEELIKSKASTLELLEIADQCNLKVKVESHLIISITPDSDHQIS